MLFSPRESIEDAIIRLLSKGKATPLDIFEQIKSEGKRASVQAVYKALRYLVKDAVVVKSGKQIAISQEWVEKVNHQLSKEFSLSTMAVGEKVEYTFNSLKQLDPFWKHIVKPLHDKYREYPIFHYVPYEIWFRIDGREESEVEFFNSFESNKQYGLYVIGNNSVIDQRMKRMYQNNYLQFDLWKTSSFNITDHISAIGDYIVVTKLNNSLARKVQHIYESAPTESEAAPTLIALLNQKHKARITVELNPKKAKLLRKKLFKNFYLPKKIQEKYHLFD